MLILLVSGGLESRLVVVPSGACLVASPPDAPRVAEDLAYLVRRWREQGEQAAGFGHGDADQASVARWCLAGAGGELPGVAPVPGLVSGAVADVRAGCGPGRHGAGRPGGRDGEQREGAHGQHGVAVEGVPQAELVLVKAGLPFPLLEAFLNRPPLMPVKRKSSLA